MVGVGNQTSDDSQDGEGVYFHVGVRLGQRVFIQSYQSVVFLVDVKVFDEALPQEIVEIFESKTQILNVALLDLGTAPLYCEQWAHEAASVTGNVDAVLLVVEVDRHELLNAASFAQEPEVAHELQRLLVHTNWLTIEEYEVMFL